MLNTLTRWFKYFTDPHDKIRRSIHEYINRDRQMRIKFKLNKQSVSVTPRSFQKCVHMIERTIYQAILRAAKLDFNTRYVATHEDVVAKYIFTYIEDRYGLSIDFYTKDLLFVNIVIHSSGVFITLGDITVQNNAFDVFPIGLRDCLESLKDEYGDYVFKQLGQADSVRIESDGTNAYFYAERVTKHEFANFSKIRTIPLANLYGSLDFAIRKFEQFDRLDWDTKSTSYAEEIYEDICGSCTCTIQTQHVKSTGLTLFTIQFSLGSAVAIFGRDHFARSFGQPDPPFFVKVSQSYMVNPSLDMVLPYMKDKYKYLEFLLELTKDARFPQREESL